MGRGKTSIAGDVAIARRNLMSSIMHFRGVGAARPVESHSEARENILAGHPKHFCDAPLGRKLLNFFFKMAHSGVLCIYERRPGSPNVAGPGVAYHTLSTGLGAAH